MAITNFKPEIWSAALLVNLRDELVYGQAGVINRNYEGEIAQAGDTVHITSFSDPAVRAYVPNNNITWDLLTDATRALVVDQFDYFAFSVDDVDRRQALGGFVDETTRGASYNLASDADTYLSGLMYTEVNGDPNDIGAVTITTPADAYETLVELRTRLTRSKVPRVGRWVAVPPEFYAALLLDPRFVDASQSGSPDALRNGQVGRAAGFDVLESNTVPEETAGVYSVLAGHPMATTFAEQIISTEAIRRENQFGDGIRGLHVYGAKVTRPTCLALASVTVSLS